MHYLKLQCNKYAIERRYTSTSAQPQAATTCATRSFTILQTGDLLQS